MSFPKIELHVHLEGLAPGEACQAGPRSALCGKATRANLTTIGRNYDWRQVPVPIGEAR